MIVNVPDPIGTEYAVSMPGGSNFIYESEEAFSAGWAIAMWFNYSLWDTLPERLITLEDLVDSSNDLRISLLVNGSGNRSIQIGGINSESSFLDTREWNLLFLTSIPGSTDIYYSINEAEAVRASLAQVPLNSRINIGGSPDRDFRGSLFDIRVYDKPLASRSGNVLYDDAINNQGNKTVPL